MRTTLLICIIVLVCIPVPTKVQAQGIGLNPLWDEGFRSRGGRQARRPTPPRQSTFSRSERPEQQGRLGHRALQTAEQPPGPLPEVPPTIKTNETVVVWVSLSLRVAAVYKDGVLVRAMPTVPGSIQNPSTKLVGKEIIIGDRTKNYWSRKRYPNGRGGMSRAHMPNALRLWYKADDGTWKKGESGYFFHKGDMSVWHSKTKGSHGCLRLTWQDSLWLWDNIASGTRVIVVA